MSDALKKKVGAAAAELVRDGMIIGIGTGSTAEAFVEALAERVHGGLKLAGVPTSERTAELCQELAIPLTNLESHPHLELTIDGADEVDPALNLIKGGGGALLREKIVAAASDEMVVICDESKLVEALGNFPLPIEVNLFGLAATRLAIEEVARGQGLNGNLRLRTDDSGKTFTTDGGHHIIDASFGRIADPVALGRALNAIPGVVEHGLFTGLATRAIVARTSGIDTIRPER